MKLRLPAGSPSLANTLSRPGFATLAVAALSLGLAACSGDGNDNGFRLPTVEFSAKQFDRTETLDTVTFRGGKTLSFSRNYGGGAFRSIQEDANLFYTVSDRGPSFDCGDALEVVGDADFCGGGTSGRVFPVDNYAPSITAWQLDGISTQLSLEQRYTLELRDSLGRKMSGLPNDRSTASTEIAFDRDGVALQPDANGINPSALVRLESGRFWVAEQYGPSLLLVDADGTVVRRELPRGAASDFSNATVSIGDSFLPASLLRRQLNDGISALALSPEEDYLYYLMKAPLSSPNADSRVVRIGKLALNGDGEISAFEGEYLYRLDSPVQYASAGKGEQGLAQADIHINEAVAIAEDVLVVVEQGGSVSKYYRINLATATKLGEPLASASGSGSAENQYLVADVPFVTKQLGTDTLSLNLPNGIEALGEVAGFAMLDANFSVLVNDNSWGLNGQPSLIRVLPIGALVVASDLPYRPKLSYDDSASVDVANAKAVAADTTNDRLFVVDGLQGAVTVVDIADPLDPQASSDQVDLNAAATAAGVNLGACQDLAVGSGFLAVICDAATPQDPGLLAIYEAESLELNASFKVGAAPRAVNFGVLGNILAVANSGEPSADYSVDPEGSISVVDFSGGIDTATLSSLSFSDFNAGAERADELPAAVRIYGPGASVAEDLEPQDISMGLDGVTAFVSLQENNAVAVVDLADQEIDRILPLGVKDYGQAGNELDVQDNGVVQLQARDGVVGMYQPDSLGAYVFQGKNYFVTANTGQARDYTGFSELTTADQLDIDGGNASRNAALSGDLSDLEVSDQAGDTDGDTDIDQITAFGARSFSIWSDEGVQLYDSGSDMARVSEALLGSSGFNNGDASSVARGPQPGGLSLAASNNRIYAFISLEAPGGVLIYDITSPLGVQFVQYLNGRDLGEVDPGAITPFFEAGLGYLAVPHRQAGNVRIFKVDGEQ